VTVFERHLDLAPLRGRRRGLVRCAFHRPDRHGSLSVDLDRGLFHCFRCGAQGGLLRFAELVGESAPAQSACHHRPIELSNKWQTVHHLWRLSDAIRRGCQFAAAARRIAFQLGESERVWDLLEHAARQERLVMAAEAELDAILLGRIA
jgi:hypothetical protein